MNGDPIAAEGEGAGASDRYLEAETALWDYFGLHPASKLIEGASQPTIRIQEVGDGEPVVFVHGTGGAGAYFAPLIVGMDGFRCLILDRPGWGLSAPVDYSAGSYSEIVHEVLSAALDGLGIERAHLVGASIGNLWALRFAMAEPARVGRVVLLGGGPISPEVGVPPFIKLLRSPVGALMVRAPETRTVFRKQLAQMGHGESLEKERIPDAFVAWHLALTRHTWWARNERAMVRAIVDRRGYVHGLVPTPAEVASLEAKVLMIYGKADPIGSVATWRRFAGGMAGGSLELIEGGGHIVWLDDPQRVAAATVRHMGAA